MRSLRPSMPIAAPLLLLLLAALVELRSPRVAAAQEVATGDEVLPYTALLPTVPSFETAKKRLYETVYVDHRTTFWCGCAFTADKAVDLASCGLSSLTSVRAQRVEVDHLVPAAAFGRTRPCWAEGGREACVKLDPVFRAFYSDLHNLVPAVGAINASRSDHGPGLIEGELREYGACDVEISSELDVVEPWPQARGDVARGYFYAEWLYGLALSEGDRRLLLTWDRTDPVDAWERLRDERVAKLQGNHNPFVR